MRKNATETRGIGDKNIVWEMRFGRLQYNDEASSFDFGTMDLLTSRQWINENTSVLSEVCTR